MPVRWRVSVNRQWAIVEYSDPYPFKQLQTVMREIFADPISRPSMRLLIDRRYSSTPDADFVRAVVSCGEQNRSKFTAARVAIVVANDASFGTGRMLELMSAAKNLPADVRTFRDMAEAERWLTQGAHVVHGTGTAS